MNNHNSYSNSASNAPMQAWTEITADEYNRLMYAPPPMYPALQDVVADVIQEAPKPRMHPPPSQSHRQDEGTPLLADDGPIIRGPDLTPQKPSANALLAIITGLPLVGIWIAMNFTLEAAWNSTTPVMLLPSHFIITIGCLFAFPPLLFMVCPPCRKDKKTQEPARLGVRFLWALLGPVCLFGATVALFFSRVTPPSYAYHNVLAILTSLFPMMVLIICFAMPRDRSFLAFFDIAGLSIGGILLVYEPSLGLAVNIPTDWRFMLCGFCFSLGVALYGVFLRKGLLATGLRLTVLAHLIVLMVSSMVFCLLYYGVPFVQVYFQNITNPGFWPNYALAGVVTAFLWLSPMHMYFGSCLTWVMFCFLGFVASNSNIFYLMRYGISSPQWTPIFIAGVVLTGGALVTAVIRSSCVGKQSDRFQREQRQKRQEIAEAYITVNINV